MKPAAPGQKPKAEGAAPIANRQSPIANSSFWHDRSVLVTGHTGFKGSWLALWLAELGARVTGYSLAPPTQPSNFEATRLGESLAGHYEADIRDGARLSAALAACRPDVVFHLAAQALVRTGHDIPRETFEVNVIGIASLLDAVRELKRPCVVVVITSDKCYENREQVWGYRENDPMGGYDPYSASKGAAELLVASYRRSFFNSDRLAQHGVRLASARAGNVIGGGDWGKDRIMTDMVLSLSKRQPVPVRNPGSVRPWQHVLEPLSGYLALASAMLSSEDPKWCGAWNFGPRPDDEATVKDLVERFCTAWGGGKWRDASDPTQPHEAGVLRLSIDKAVRELGWRPRWNLEQAINHSVTWYRSYYRDPTGSMYDACRKDIADYEAVRPAVST
ncbi:MAG TPA: CDP-glucose 4,6-dehydratase [bacterium]|nr:CDP-glucose 4,6-dehydratase [bacterium]